MSLVRADGSSLSLSVGTGCKEARMWYNPKFWELPEPYGR